MKNLQTRINYFIKHYALDLRKVSKSDMRNINTMMGVFESLWLTVNECGDMLTTSEYQWISALYGDLGDYIAAMPEPVYRWQSAVMGNIVTTFGEVLRQMWDSLIHYHTIDIVWIYCREGY